MSDTVAAVDDGDDHLPLMAFECVVMAPKLNVHKRKSRTGQKQNRNTKSKIVVVAVRIDGGLLCQLAFVNKTVSHLCKKKTVDCPASEATTGQCQIG